WIDVAYEDLVADAPGVLERLFDGLGVTYTGRVRRFAAEMIRRPSATALSPPRREKWREENRELVERVLPLVRTTEARMGYEPG
ncbi:MAG TPA: hypothetical protein VHF23_00945, partial [Gaiellaceae bacterium]|nr:hypothetical protein [Gaiellaceae bacterium]